MNYNLDHKNTTTVIQLQKRVKLNRINNYLSKFSLTQLDNEFKQLDYIKTMEKLMNKKLQNKINILMFRINRYLNPEKKTMLKIVGRMFLTLYLLKYHSNEVLVTVNIHDKTMLHYQACNIINYLNDIFMKNVNYRTFSISRFGSMFNVYCIRYNQLQQQDKVNMINEPYRHYANIKATMKYVKNCGKYPEDQKADVLKVLETEITKTHDCIKMLDKNFDIKKFEEIVSIEDEVRNNFTEAYWDKLRNELKEEKYDELVNLLTKLKNVIIDIHPKLEDVKVNGTLKTQDKETIRKQFDEYVDVDFIKHMLVNRVMDGEQIIKLCSYLMDTVKELQASSRDIEVAVMWETMINDFREQKITVVDFIPMFFKAIFGVIDKICADVLLLPIVRGTSRMSWNDSGMGDRCM